MNRYERLLGKCLHCTSEFTFRYINSAGKYCSNACQQLYQANIRCSEVLEAQSLKGFSPASAKRFAVKLWGHKCNLCNKKTWQSEPIPLVLDHINGNSDDWSFLNLRLICCNCDAQTATYKGRNRGNGRHSRRLRYAENKSY